MTEPLTAGPHPGIVIVHGSGPGPRIDYGIWVGLYASLGLTVLAYDKRGNGASTGIYPGEQPSDAALAVYADDAASAARFLASWPGVDPGRVGFHGGSQGGWIVPLAFQRFPSGAFAVLASAPAVTTGQQSVFAAFSAGSSGSRTCPTRSNWPRRRRTAPVRSRTGARRHAATGALTERLIDHQVPTALTVKILRSLNRPNWKSMCCLVSIMAS